MRYKVYESEERVTPKGKKLKKLVLMGEGKQYPDKNVTIWANHPAYPIATPGNVIDVELDVTDSATINPRSGMPYKNKTVRDTPGATRQASAPRPQPEAAQSVTPTRAENAILFSVIPKLIQIDATLNAICGHLQIEVPDGKKYDYPEHKTGVNDASGLDFGDDGPPAVTRDDTPFGDDSF